MRCVSCGAELLPGKSFCHACGARAPQACANCGAALDPSFRFCPDCGHPTGAATVPTAAVTTSPASTAGTLAAVSPIAAVPPPAVPPAEPPASPSLTVPDELAHKIRAMGHAIAGERKIVTVLFCDLVGSTALAEGLDPEEYHDLLDEYLELAFREIYRLEGIVNQLAGDGFMALFGAPIAHEDAPQRAVHAALNIRAALRAFNQQPGAANRPDLRARIGIHTGPVVVGTVGNDLKMDYSAVGDTTNLAARLESLAAPGTILISQATSRLVHGHFDMQPIGPLAVKGKSEPIEAYEVHSAAEVTASISVAPGRGLTPFVGRQAELAQLESCFRRLADELPQVVAVVGQAGSGKSRLLYEFKQRLGDAPAAIFEGRCSAWNQMVPYHPWVSMLRHFFEIGSDDTAQIACEKIATKVRPWDLQLDRAYPYICRMLSLRADGAANLDGDDLKQRTFEAVGALFVAEMTRGRVVVFIEDLQWIDDPSREMLEAALAQMVTKPFMFVLSHRPDFQPVWRTHAAFTQLTLRRLTEGNLSAIVRSLAGGPLPDELEGMILAKSEGSPFLTEEITRSLLEEGDVIGENGGFRLTRPPEEIRIPGTVQEVIAARLDRLSASAKRVVQVAAVFGRQFSRERLAEMLVPEGIDVAQELDELERRGVVHRKNLFSTDEYRFGESLTQEVAYEGLLLKQRRQLHERIGTLLEASPDDQTAERLAMVAHHFSRGDNPDKTVRALLASAQAAEQIPAYRTAARAYRDAWDLTAASGTPATPGPLVSLALEAATCLCRMTVIYNVPDPGDLETVIGKARELAHAIGDTSALAGLRAFHGMLLMRRGRARFGEGLSLVEEGLALAERSGQLPTVIAVSRALAWSYLLDGRFALARRTIEWVVTEMERGRSTPPTGDLYLGARWMRDAIALHSDRFDAAMQTATETYDLAVQASNRTVQSSAATMRALIHLFRAEYGEAQRWAERALPVAQVIGNASTQAIAVAVQLIAARATNRRPATGRAAEILEQCVGEITDLATNVHILVEGLVCIGELRLAERAAQRAHAQAGGRIREMHCALALGHVCFLLGPDRWVDAERWYEEAIALANAVGARAMLAAGLLGAAELAAARGDAAAGIHHLQESLAVSTELGLGHFRIPAEHLLAQLAGTAPSPVAAHAP